MFLQSVPASQVNIESGPRRLYAHSERPTVPARGDHLAIRKATPAVRPPMQRYFRSIQSVSAQAQDFPGLGWVWSHCGLQTSHT